MDYHAIKNGDIETLQKQLDDGVKIDEINFNIMNSRFSTPLHMACSHSNFPVIRFLVSNGHPINILGEESKYHQTAPIHELINQGKLYNAWNVDDIFQIFKYLCEHGADINILTYPTKQTILHYLPFFSINRSLIVLIRYLLILGADPMIMDKNGISFVDMVHKELNISLGKKDHISLGRKDHSNAILHYSNVNEILDMIHEFMKQRRTLFSIMLPVLYKKDKKNIKKQRI